MALELIVNILLFVFFGFCFWYVGSTMPKSATTELGAEQWPQLLLLLLMIFIVVNIVNYFKRNEKQKIAAAFANFFPGIVRFVKSKLFIGMLLVLAMALAYEPLGFLTTSLLLLTVYGILLGARRLPVLLISAVVITLILYISFSVFLGVMLPRGSIPFLRSAALFLESIFQRI
ncbi:MAG: tripartite tricarboxylate transporter TctB family protein [Treponema sp.]|nr:tripartite tricarboxylate transporter TctB family protein [Treponema sp.]